MAIFALFLVVLFGLYVWGRASQKVNVEVHFIGYTNRHPNEVIALLNINNLGSSGVLPFECLLNGNRCGMPVDYLEGKSSRKIEVRIQSPVLEGSKLNLGFRLKDSAIEEFREGLDSVLRSLRIRIPGLNPNSAENPEVVECDIPPYP